MTLEEKIDKVFKKYKLLNDWGSIEQWCSLSSNEPSSISDFRKREFLEFTHVTLQMDLLIYNASEKECNKCNSKYIKSAKRWMKRHNFQVEWVRLYSEVLED